MMILHRKSGHKTECLLCPHNCKLDEGRSGICHVRSNTGGEIKLNTYGILSSLSADPIEKKPLYHFFPGYNILSAGSYGCNMRCDFCQNYNISQCGYEPSKNENIISPRSLVDKALYTNRNIGLAFTYNEPVIWFEYMRDVAQLARKNNMFTVMVSNGYVCNEPLSEILDFIDAFNIDLKSFSDDFYRKLTGSSIEPVKNTLKRIASSGKHLEITTLIIPGQNDSVEEIERETEWIAGELGKHIPLHLSRYFPMYRSNNPVTPDGTLLKLYNSAAEKLDYVYVGNIKTDYGQNTNCPVCDLAVTLRSGYSISLQNLDRSGRCKGCGNLIYPYFTISSS